jgi:hypothetical protein
MSRRPALKQAGVPGDDLVPHLDGVELRLEVAHDQGQQRRDLPHSPTTCVDPVGRFGAGPSEGTRTTGVTSADRGLDYRCRVVTSSTRPYSTAWLASKTRPPRRSDATSWGSRLVAVAIRPHRSPT